MLTLVWFLTFSTLGDLPLAIFGRMRQGSKHHVDYGLPVNLCPTRLNARCVSMIRATFGRISGSSNYIALSGVLAQLILPSTVLLKELTSSSLTPKPTWSRLQSQVAPAVRHLVCSQVNSKSNRVTDVAQEIIDGLVATKKHEILLFTRKVSPPTRICKSSDRQQDPPPSDPSSGVTWAKTDYLDVKQLTSLLAGTHTVFSFVAPYLDQEEAFNAQKNLIDASIQAGVKRLAPSEWAS